MNGFQPISYGEVMPNINIDTDEIMQRLVNIQTYSSLILNNIGIPINTGIILPEFAYNGEVSQTGYGTSYGQTIMLCGRNYDFELGLNMDGITTQHFLSITLKFNNETYTAYPEYRPNGYFYTAGTYSCPLDIYVADKALLWTQYTPSPGHCAIKFCLNKNIRGPITVLGIGQVRAKWAVPQY